MHASAPAGYHTITPRIFTDDVEGLVGFLKGVFAATGEYKAGAPVEIRIGDSLIMISSAAVRGPMPACLYVYVDDADATYGRALEAGADPVEDPRDVPYGDRRAVVTDSWGNLWQIATRK